LSDAPNDANYYARKGNAWAVVPLGIPDAPNDTNSYVRKGQAWAIAATGNGEAPNDSNAYVRKGLNWSIALVDAPNDASYYARKGGAWAVVPTGLADAPNDTNYYARKGQAWSSFTPGIGDAPNDGAQYIRKGLAWASLDTYNLKVAAAASGVLDLAAGNVFTVANSTATTISFKAGTQPSASRAMTVILTISGSATITWPTITWDKGAAPVLGASYTVVTLLWDGTRWYGCQGTTV
jgi:hypothetical protein